MSKRRPLGPAEVTRLEQIPNVGPATAEDLRRLGIDWPNELTDRDPLVMYRQLCEADGCRHDPCVLDVFMAAVGFMAGQAPRPWWKYTAQRKRLLAEEAAADRPADGQTAKQTARILGRRAVLQDGLLLLLAGHASSWVRGVARGAEPVARRVRFGVLTDLHYADKRPSGTRHYRETPRKLAAADEQFRSLNPEFVIELGDFIDSADSLEAEQGYLRTIHARFAELPGRKYYVLGNHCVAALTKDEFLTIVEQPRPHYRFDVHNVRFIVLDACFRQDLVPYGRNNFQWTDANIPPEQIRWLEQELAQAPGDVVVFVHQRLDVEGAYGVKNAPAVRRTLEQSGKVRGVLQGHYHHNDYREVGGIHYVTFAAMVEGSGPTDNSFAVVDVLADGTIAVRGFQQQASYRLASATATGGQEG